MIGPSFHLFAPDCSPIERMQQAAPPPYHPRLRKYHWWVFHKESPCDGIEFITRTYRLNGFEAQKSIQSLRGRGEVFFVYHQWNPRRCELFDPNATRWKDAEWALAFEDDPDPECGGFK